MGSLNWTGRRRLPLIRQTESAECGLACLAMMASWHGLQTDLPTLRDRFSISTQGMTLQRLIECAAGIRMSSRAVRLEPEDLKSLSLPCILHWNMNHFVVLHKVSGSRLVIHDPDKGKVTISLTEAGKHFTGVALELMPASDFTARDERKKIRLRQLTGKTPGLLAAMSRIIVFALALEILTLGSPLLNQLVIDEVLVAADRSLLSVVIIALLLLSLTQMFLSLARQWASITLSVNFNMQWTARVFHHLVRLPLAWFDARSKGSINARFEAVDMIQQALTTQVLEGILDVLLAVTALCMMLLYSPEMTLIAVLAAIFYGVLRALWYPSLRQSAEDAWDAGARESGHFLETLNGILSLRINGVTAYREAAWLNLNVTRRNTQLRQSRLLMCYDIVHTLTGSVVSAVILWKGAGEVLNGTFTVGMLVAYLSYQMRFSSSISSLTDKFFAWRMLDVYNERLADIVLTPTESHQQQPDKEDNNMSVIPFEFWGTTAEDACPPLSMEHIIFSHKGGNKPILRGVSMTLYPGEVVAITGKSGCGKSTLVKLILGIHIPDEGTIRTFGIPQTHPDYFQVRRRIGTVLQDDHLFRGTIADNIIFFSEDRNQERMLQCARLALIDIDIMAMPMGYQTLIGETGGGLSGGQKQRILLARALYKKPGFLLLDEATSHLDVESEIKISQTLRQLGLPVLLIAHRPETIASADRVLCLADGYFTELKYQRTADDNDLVCNLTDE
ncbi:MULTISPECIES: peptidase domain-containing ABC transporter [Enterobacter cloacae complex]|uniref:peptidase domain-containing ABC transporter n=1 Tax=Enterobacter cloacae complex TaxID=354276 RepID=UPI001432C302|nr:MULTISPECIES: peptidase domain-containing ABC transporter [Enterobacter cloacae complex]MCM7097623.1 peptidase domain-containing ABC transporter [Enterobacter kobei]NKD22878.1 peptidase domain-containing ABC transporter [Enterobacter asburiae]HDS5358899.1 peptidase domain-containing ABC transporter [Enterobacter roggenkampii]HEO9917019.1 peptidase domain-containing ABC transporter [Enterobacter asburiae]